MIILLQPLEIAFKIRDIQTEINGTIFLQNSFDIYVTTSP